MKDYTIEHLKKGRRLYGAFFNFDDGRKVYIAYRRNKEIFRGGRKSISDALRDGVAAWAIDDDTIREARARGCKAIGVRVRDTGDIYITNLSNFMDKDKIKVLNYSRRGGSLQRYLPMEHWRMKAGRVKL